METTATTPSNDHDSIPERHTTVRRRLTGVLAAGALAGTSLIAGAAPAQAATGVYVSGGTLYVNASTGW